MPIALADANIALVALKTKPADPRKPTATELNKGVRLECRVVKNTYNIGSAGSSTVSEVPLCAKGEGNLPGPPTFEGSLDVFRYYQADGAPSTEEDVAWELLKKAGTELWLYERESPKGYAPQFAENDEVDFYHVMTGQPTKPSNRSEGYIKRTVKLFVQDAEENTVKVAGG